MHCISLAKVNLFLKVVSKRDDGYHNLISVLQLVDCYDELEIQPSSKFCLSIKCDDSLPSGEDNLVVKAYRLFCEYIDVHNPVTINLRKRIPTGAGLGGGSSNAATLLLALNRLWQANLPVEQLAKLGSSLGADIPFFIHGHNALIEGIGERVTKIDIDSGWYLICLTNLMCSTARVFSSCSINGQLTSANELVGLPAPDGTYAQINALNLAKSHRPLDLVGLGNDLQDVVFVLYPRLRKVYQALSNHGSFSMSGSGSSFFTWVSSCYEAKQLQAVLGRLLNDCRFVVAKGVSYNDWARYQHYS